MKIDECISLDFPTVDLYAGINSIQSLLLERQYLVVIDDLKKFKGILTPSDIIEHPHKIVIDCLTEKNTVSYNETFASVLNKFNVAGTHALAVFKNENFIGIIEKNSLIKNVRNTIEELQTKSSLSRNLKTSFLSNLSHEIRTPLNGLLGFLDIISNLEANEYKLELEKDNEIIRQSAERFLLIMNDLIDLSIINSGGDLRIEKATVKIETIFNDLKEYFETSSGTHNNKVSVIFINPEKSFDICSDGKRIKHILYHLIDNAIKHSESKVVICGYELIDDNAYIRFYVINSGPRIDDNIKDKMFELCEKSNSSDNIANQGLGIGLPLVKHLSEKLGGNISFESNSDRTTFSCIFPL